MLAYILLLALLSLSRASFTLQLNPAARRTYPADILGEWRLVEAEPTAECPKTIRYLGFTRDREGPFRILHSNILQDGVRCDESKTPGKNRRFRFFTKVAINRKLSKRKSSYRVPKQLLDIVKRPGPARRVRRAAQRSKEMYYVGFESVHRVCNGTTLFRRGTTSFLLRPFRNDVVVHKFKTILTPKKKWMVVVPYKSKACVYESELNRFATEEEATPDAEITPEEEQGDGNVDLEGSVSEAGECFPGGALVTLRDGRSIAMRSLRVGDEVAVGGGEYSPVYMFTHRMEKAWSWFVRLELWGGETVQATPGHVFYVNGEMQEMGEVRIGDVVRLADGSEGRVRRVELERLKGLYNPQTMRGDIVVDGVWATTYTRRIKVEVAHALLTPVRGVFEWAGVDVSWGALEGGWVW